MLVFHNLDSKHVRCYRAKLWITLGSHEATGLWICKMSLHVHGVLWGEKFAAMEASTSIRLGGFLFFEYRSTAIILLLDDHEVHESLSDPIAVYWIHELCMRLRVLWASKPFLLMLKKVVELRGTFSRFWSGVSIYLPAWQRHCVCSIFQLEHKRH